MSGTERKAPDDKLLEDFLEGRSPASRAWREAMRGESAPPELDDAVLGMARRELRAAAAKPPSRDRFRDRRWPFALAAVLVLSFSTLLTIVQDPVAHKEAMMVAPDVAPADAVILPEASAPVAAPAALEPQTQAREARAQSAQAKRRAEASPAKPSSAAERAGAGSYADTMQEPAASAASAAPEAEVMAAPAMASAAPPPAAAPVMEESRDAAPAELKAASAAERHRRALSSDSLGAAKLKRKSAEPAAAAELERIRRMLAEGQEEEARQALNAWRKNWPERAVPADLQRLLD